MNYCVGYTYLPVDTEAPIVNELLPIVVQWCFDNIGPFMRDWSHERDMYGRVMQFRFRHAEDALAFKMRWLIC